MNVKPKFVYYDIRRKQSVCLIMYTHENDVDTQVLEVSMLDNGEPIELSADYTYTAAIVNRETKALINDNISCELNDSGNVLIPIDNFHTLGAQDLLIELTITDGAGNQVLVTPFPLWIHVNASILDDAQVTPESLGTVPELLEEAKEALENAGDYENLENKPQINGHGLVGDKTGDDLGLQNKLTAGENVTIDNGVISASGGVTSYSELSDKPRFSLGNTSVTISRVVLLSKYFRKYTILDSPWGGIDLTANIFKYRAGSVGIYDFNDILNEYWESCVYRFPLQGIQNLPYEFPDINRNDYNQRIYVIHLFEKEGTLHSADETGTIFVRAVIYQGTSGKIRIYSQHGNLIKSGINEPFATPTNMSEWEEVNPTISSATVNQNGTITFTMSDGLTVTTTGSVTYTLTEQDKQDIADIVIQRLNNQN